MSLHQSKSSILTVDPFSESDADETHSNDPPPPGEGFNIWSRVATAASSLTVNVGKAWSANIITSAGEGPSPVDPTRFNAHVNCLDTPVGQESRLTRAMKAYHLEKARDPSDLPEWLFAEHERQPARSRTPARRTGPSADGESAEYTSENAKPRGLRDIYASAANAPSAMPARPARAYADAGSTPAAGTNRLKALREAKRNALLEGGAGADQGADAPRGVYRARDREEPERQPAPRMGLPSGPSARSRRF